MFFLSLDGGVEGDWRLDDVYVRCRDQPSSGRCLTNAAGSSDQPASASTAASLMGASRATGCG